MSTEIVPVRRAAFAATASSALAEQVGSDFERLPERRGWTDRAVWYQRPGELLAVVGDHEESATDLVLAHALLHAGDRAVTLVLPENWAYPTRFRQPWLTPNIKVWTHTDGVAAFAPPWRGKQPGMRSSGIRRRSHTGCLQRLPNGCGG